MNNLLLAYYGDDFTGSTDVMEALSRAGLRTVLFLQPPAPEQLAKFPGLRAFGIAGGSRTFSPAEMERELPPAFTALKASGAPIIHYKVCSTFDSSPGLGSIGRAIEIGRRVFGDVPTPLVIGAPVLGRYVAFGNLFARSGLDSEPARLDRHPTMSRHPVTPMNEADLRRVLATQTNLRVELVDLLKLERPDFRFPVFTWQEGIPEPVVLFDTVRQAHLPLLGRAIAEFAEKNPPLFCVGSSGLEYALVEHWQAMAMTRASGASSDGGKTRPGIGPRSASVTTEPAWSPSAPVAQIIAVSGSCSPVTGRQIDRALEEDEHEFVEFSAGPELLASGGPCERLLGKSFAALAAGQSVILHSSRGPDDARFAPGFSRQQQAALAGALAALLEDLRKATGLRRAVVCGGDTSTHVARALGIEALEYLAPMAPGSPLCHVHAPGRIADGCEIVFKGGQVGGDDFFLDVRNGGPTPTP